MSLNLATVKGGKANSAPDPPALPQAAADPATIRPSRRRDGGGPFRRKRPTWQGPRVAAPKCRRWRRNSRERGRSMDELRVAQERELEALQRATEMGRWPRRNRRSASAEQRQNDGRRPPHNSAGTSGALAHCKHARDLSLIHI